MHRSILIDMLLKIERRKAQIWTMNVLWNQNNSNLAYIPHQKVCLCYSTSSSPTKLEALASNSRGNNEGSTSFSAQLQHITEKHNLRQVLPHQKKNISMWSNTSPLKLVIKIETFYSGGSFLFLYKSSTVQKSDTKKVAYPETPSATAITPPL